MQAEEVRQEMEADAEKQKAELKEELKAELKEILEIEHAAHSGHGHGHSHGHGHGSHEHDSHGYQTVSIGLGMQSAAEWADDEAFEGEHPGHHGHSHEHEHDHSWEHDLAAEVSQMREVRGSIPSSPTVCLCIMAPVVTARGGRVPPRGDVLRAPTPHTISRL